ncbi:CIA30 family protein [Rheinheimera salexigens]|uniref:Uncharacterized protein n=1 Tax=Rheinheimera salexigens TaxID=1628148 RepID=A0A1E7Q647_9GAMM|nr:CIA30 family protein [Rheinheimera salexigens]OEY69649.1 hypothetical protein BI198_08830 [Rheinheimera salexigens]
MRTVNYLLVLIALFTNNTAVHAEAIKPMTDKLTLTTNGKNEAKAIQLNFANPQHFKDIATVNDTVMGGRSSAKVKKVKLTDD